MRIQLRILLAFVGATLCYGLVVEGQNREKAAEGVKKALDPANKAATGAAQKPAPAGATKTAAPAATATASDAEEKTIRASAEAYTKLYNDHDAKGLGALFSPKAEVIDEDGTVTRGREAIQKSFVDIFKRYPKSSMEVEVESVRILASTLGIEEGTARSKNSPDDAESVTTYVAIHVKQDGKWLLACIRDWVASGAEMTPHDHLEELAWLVGDWVEETPHSVVHTTCQWHDNGNFLMQEFHVRVDGKEMLSGTTRIGWDAVANQFRSWVFDSSGGHATGLWLHDGDEWLVKSQGATSSGKVASATNVYRQIDNDTIGWRSVERILDGERREDHAEIVIKRRPPQPGE